MGGALALIGAFIYAELAVLRPRVGGQYAYLRDAYHPTEKTAIRQADAGTRGISLACR